MEVNHVEPTLPAPTAAIATESAKQPDPKITPQVKPLTPTADKINTAMV